MKVKRDIGQELLEGVRAIQHGHGIRKEVKQPIGVSTIRHRLKLSQSAFAALLAVSIRTLQDWEQGRRTPRGPAMSLLRVAQKHPEAFISL